MANLLLATVLWSVSFGLIKHFLADVDATLVAWLRLTIAAVVLLPWLRWAELQRWPSPPGRIALALLGLGGLQFGLMYLGYIAAFAYASAHEIALFTITTPIYVCLLHDLRSRRFDPIALGLAVLALLGALLVIPQNTARGDVWLAFLLVQASNLCFAGGQLGYRYLRQRADGVRDQHIIAWMYIGGLVVAAVAVTIRGRWPDLATLDRTHLWSLGYLGAVASGLGFLLWNRGAVTAAPGALAALNNLKIPAAVVVSVVVFGETADMTRVLGGGNLMLLAAILASARTPRPPT